MKALRIDGQTPGGKRTKLADVIPLDTPYILQIFPIYACNLACPYCIHAVDEKKRKFVAEESILDFSVYKKCIDGLTGFPQKLKMLRFAGTGEPLLHKNIAEMIDYAAKKSIADSIDIVTNGLLLEKKLADKLVQAGTNCIRISVQGINDSPYDYTGRAGLFSKLVENVKYLYQNRKSTKIYIKILDASLKNKEEEKEFLHIFGDICDFIAIEHLIPAVEQIDYSKLGDISDLTQNGRELQNAKVCPQPFYIMQLNPDGNLVPCCSMETAYICGNVKNENIVGIWQGEKYNIFRIKQLLKQKDVYAVCKKCHEYKYTMFPEDVLDNDITSIKMRLHK